MRPGSPRRHRGFTYFGLLLAIASAAGAIAGGAYLLANDLRRDKELDLLFAGDEIRRAIEAYHARNASGVDPYPRTLEALLRDPNQPSVVRHLRRVRQDPMREAGAEPPPADTGGWTLIRNAQGQVIGVHSPSVTAPLKRSGFPKHYDSFSQARGYSDWKFVAAGALQAPVTTPAGGGNFIPSPISPSGPLVPAGRGVPAAPAPVQPPPLPTAAAASPAPVTSPAREAATAAPAVSPVPAPTTATAAVPPADPVVPPAPASPLSPQVPTASSPVPVPPPPASAVAPVASQPVPSPAPVAAPAASQGATAPATAAPQSAAVPAAAVPAPAGPAGAAAPAPTVPPSLQGDGPQPFQIRTF